MMTSDSSDNLLENTNAMQYITDHFKKMKKVVIHPLICLTFNQFFCNFFTVVKSSVGQIKASFGSNCGFFIFFARGLKIHGDFPWIFLPWISKFLWI
jgi:hypothetical protein